MKRRSADDFRVRAGAGDDTLSLIRTTVADHGEPDLGGGANVGP